MTQQERERTQHPTSYAKAKQMKLLTVITHSWSQPLSLLLSTIAPVYTDGTLNQSPKQVNIQKIGSQELC